MWINKEEDIYLSDNVPMPGPYRQDFVDGGPESPNSNVPGEGRGWGGGVDDPNFWSLAYPERVVHMAEQ